MRSRRRRLQRQRRKWQLVPGFGIEFTPNGPQVYLEFDRRQPFFRLWGRPQGCFFGANKIRSSV